MQYCRLLFAALVAVSLNSARAQIVPPATSDRGMTAVPGRSPDNGNEVVAIINGRILSQRDVQLAWLPVYERVVEEARRKGLSPQQRNARLQEEWRATIKRLVQEQLILQESNRERRRLEELYAGALLASSDMTPAMARAEARAKIQEVEEDYFARWRDEAVEEIGGWSKLQEMLKRHNQTRREWETQLREQLLVRAFLEQQVGQVVISPQAIRKYYENHREEFRTPRKHGYREILLKRDRFKSDRSYEAAIEAVQEALATESGKANFGLLAQKISHADSAERGGLVMVADEALLSEEVHHPAVEKALSALDVGGVAGPIDTRQGTYFVKLEIREGGELQSLDDAQQTIEGELRGRRLHERRQALFRKLREGARIEIRNTELPARYRAEMAAGEEVTTEEAPEDR